MADDSTESPQRWTAKRWPLLKDEQIKTLKQKVGELVRDLDDPDLEPETCSPRE